MLNAKSGLVDFLKPSTGVVADKRQGNAGQESAGLFGDTLRGQMKQAAEGRETPPAKAPPSQTSPAADKEATASAADEASGGVAAEQGAELAESAEVHSESDAETVLVAPVSPQVLELPEEALRLTPGAEAELTAEAVAPAEAAGAESGKELPVMVPSLAANEGEDTGMPRWLRLHGLERAAANPTAAAHLQHASSLVAEAAEGPPLEDDFLHGLRAAMGQDGGKNESQLGDGMAKGQSAEALFKLAGMSLSKEAPLAPSAGAATAGPTPTTTTLPTGASQLPQLALDAPMRQPGWDQAFAERVVWLARQGLQQAEIQLNPRHLGPIEVHVSVDKDQASVTFMAQHAMTREALEAAIPRLREMLQGNGLNLAQSEVSQHSFGQQQREAMGSAGEQGRRGDDGSELAEQDEAVLAETALESGRGLSAVDYYA